MARRKSLAAKLLVPKKRKRRKSVLASIVSGSGNTQRWSSDNLPPKADIPKIDPFVVPEGEWHQHVFIYDGRPLIGRKKGERFMVDVVNGSYSMTSIYTGMRWKSNKIVAYKGRMFGHIGDGLISEHLVKLVRKYGRVTVTAMRTGVAEGGWPIVDLLVPYSRRGDPEKDWLAGYL